MGQNICTGAFVVDPEEDGTQGYFRSPSENPRKSWEGEKLEILREVDEDDPEAELKRLAEFSEHDKSVLRCSWRLMGLDRTSIGTLFILQLFRIHPEYLSLFQALAALDSESLGGSSALHAHAITFMHSMAGIVESLDDVELLVSLLKRTADRHKNFGLTEQDFDKATAVFLKVLKTVEGLDSLEYDRKTIIHAWGKAIATIVKVIGMHLPNLDDLESE